MSMTDWRNLELAILSYGERAVAAATRELDDVGDEILAEAKSLAPMSPTNRFIDGTTGGRKDEARKGKRRKVNPFYTGTTGSLRESGQAPPAERAGDAIVKRVKFTAKYAAAVHERTAVRHGKALLADAPYLRGINPEGQAKFLSVPVLRRRRSTPARIARAVEGVRLG